MWKDEKAKRNFPSIDKMNREIIKRHNEKVSKTDVTYHLGDFTWLKSWKDSEHILKSLNGKHHLILGNHDLFSPWDYINMGFTTVHTHLILHDFLLVHDPAVAGGCTDMFVVHGHTHALGKRLSSKTLCVSCEVVDYTPMSLSEIRLDFAGRE